MKLPTPLPGRFHQPCRSCMRWLSGLALLAASWLLFSGMLHAQTPSSSSVVREAPLRVGTSGPSEPPAVQNEAGRFPQGPIRLVPRSATESPRHEPIPLPPVSDSSSIKKPKAAGSSNVIFTMVSSLAIVLALFFVVVWISRRAFPKVLGGLPKEALEILGRSSIGQRQQLQLVRVGNKILLVCITPTSASTLTEITDPREVDRLAGLCQQGQAGSASANFRQILSAAAQGDPRPATRSATAGWES